MKVRAVHTQGLVPATADDTLLQAATTMQEYEVGCLPVFRGDDLIGVFTERDLVRAIAEGVQPEAATIQEYMSFEPVTVEIDADLQVAAAEMLRAGVRHLPVVEAGKVVGMVSIRDVIVEQAAGPEGDIS
jgi:CBS domain-containing protein